jgi:6-phosphogluconate dehydrogenase
MQIGMIGLGRMGSNMVRRLLRAGHECVVYDVHPAPVRELVAEQAVGASTLDDFCSKLRSPRAVWMMIPAAFVDKMLSDLVLRLKEGDIVVDGGNSYYVDDIRRAGEMERAGIQYVDVGTSGGVWGLERGYCQMIGGPEEAVRHLDPIFRALAPGLGSAPVTLGAKKGAGTEQEGYLHCGPSGAGHFVKMVHNGIEYGLMAAYAEGFNILRHANVGRSSSAADAETSPMRNPERYRFDLDLLRIAEVWRRGSVITSWLLDLGAAALLKDPELSGFEGRVSDSGEGRWTIQAAVEEGTPAPVLTTALFQRFSSRGEGDFADRFLSALRFQFGGHEERKS